MSKTHQTPGPMPIMLQQLRYLLLLLPVSTATALMVALFLWLLNWATVTRWQHPWLIFLLPVAGWLIYFIDTRWGKNVTRGNQLIIEEINTPDKGVPPKITLLIFFSTIITHLFGGSAGREGTAVQMGGGIAAAISSFTALAQKEKTVLLICGIAAGFGAVFGTPFAGAVFALEIVAVGKLRYEIILPCLAAALLGNAVCLATGIAHTTYHINLASGGFLLFSWLRFDAVLVLKAMLSGCLFGVAAYCFVQLSDAVKTTAKKYIPLPWLIPIIGAILIISMSYALDSFDYLGLGVVQPNHGVSISSAFSANGAGYFSWWWKLLLTAITLGMGFKGGEVTPLFFIGATLGNTLAVLSGAPIDLFAALGLIAVFAAATNAPIASTILGMELFGSSMFIYFVLVCFVAFYCSGSRSIYTVPKNGFYKMDTL
jgi:H+/Cl- antiporter ClcA